MSSSLVGLPNLDLTTPWFRAKLMQTAEALGMNPDYLATVISFESGFNPQSENLAGSSAVGLIQFTKPARDALGVTRDQVLGMSAEDQLDLVRRYFAPYGGRLRTLEDVYLAVLYPWGIGKSPDTRLMPREGQDSREYDQNAKLDREGKGYITVADVARKIRGHYQNALERPRVPVEGGSVVPGRGAAGGAAMLLLFAGLGAMLWRRRRG
jgi:hypothetical protein